MFLMSEMKQSPEIRPGRQDLLEAGFRDAPARKGNKLETLNPKT